MAAFIFSKLPAGARSSGILVVEAELVSAVFEVDAFADIVLKVNCEWLVVNCEWIE
jgi:hypothetical protein